MKRFIANGVGQISYIKPLFVEAVMQKSYIITILLITFLVSSTVGYGSPVLTKKKILFVDSYHEGYPWSEGITKGVRKTLSVGKLKDSIDLKITRMDTKRNITEEFKKTAALKVKALINSWRPDVVIAADDNASKFLIVPYFKGKSLPFVFCGVNWDASAYGFPCSNVTGMVEVSLIPQLIEKLEVNAKGKRIGLLGADNLSNRKEAVNYKKIFKVDLEQEVFVKTFEDLKSAFKQIQKEVDMLILAPPSFLRTDSDKKEAAKFFEEHTIIPTGSVEDWITPNTLIGYTKIAEEQGEWAARKALEILDGKSPVDIPIVKNKKAKVYLNMRIAKKLNIIFSMDLIEQATFVEKEQR